ncbi:BamA/TamA family outer membrane protein [Ohtaekwangia koreensis]|uniref:Surface antigen variable number repeat-containing protein n=1 Tax=Ohtaekwangia koreensis TaxID=688867 RepID=A0A1T5JYX0_9BACT|nr:BamA/TamA family outer membrane protein [Ohtaekwangia koreensis]SKC56556.1 Surface antigen variable number repeat-containing protein [Ohtaekwangia koreensis]
MLAIIFSLISFFTPAKSTQISDSTALSDSTKRPSRTRIVADSTGRFLRINRIFIVGNRVTRDPIILRELTLKSGDFIYSSDLQSILEVDKKKLINTRLFNTVEIRTLELETDQVDLLIDLNERWYTFPSPIFELADRNFNEWWQNYGHDFSRVNYGLRLYQYNMRGRNETLRFLAQFGFSRRFGITYRFPYIDKKQRHGLAIDFDFAETKNLAYRTADHKLVFLESEDIVRTMRTGGLTYTYRPSFYESHILSLFYKSTTIRDTVALLNPDYLGKENRSQQFAALTYQFNSDHRDYIGYPLRGYYLSAFATQNGLAASDDVKKFEISATFASFIDLQKGFYLSNYTVGYWSNPKNLPYYNYGALGYQKQIIRGYEIYVIEGPEYILNKTTFKKKILSRTYHWGAMPIPQFRHIPLAIYLKTYADVGYVSNYPNYEVNSRLTNKFLSGVGAGIDIVGSYDMVFRFEYTYNAEGDRGFFFNIKKEF